MENRFNGGLLEEVTEVSDAVLDNRAAGVKGFLIGAVVVGAGWLGTSLYKKIKQRKSIEEQPEVIEESEKEV